MYSFPPVGAAVLWGLLAAGCASLPAPRQHTLGAATCGSAPLSVGPELLATVVQPFQIVFEHDDVHAMLYFEGHPTYEAIETMIRERAGQPPLVRVILTRHDQTQVDYFSDEAVAERKRQSNVGRETHHAPIEYTHSVVGGRPRVALRFVSAQGERVEFDLRAVGEPSARYAGLTNPGRHAEQSALPVMYRYRSTLAAPESRMAFDGRAYKVPTQVWVPLLFTGLRGYYSEGFRRGVFKEGNQLMQSQAAPEPHPQRRHGPVTQGPPYTVTQVGQGGFILERAEERILLAREGGCLGIRQILLGAGAGADGQGGSFAIRFEPLLPLAAAMADGQSTEVAFSIDIDRNTDLLTGTVAVARSQGEVQLRLVPERPGWAARRIVSTRIRAVKDGHYMLEAEVLPAP